MTHTHKVSTSKKPSINCNIRVWISFGTNSLRGNSFILSCLIYKTDVTLAWPVSKEQCHPLHVGFTFITALVTEFFYSCMPSVYLNKLWIDKRRRPCLSLYILYSILVEHQMLDKLSITGHQKGHINQCNETFTNSRKKNLCPTWPLSQKQTFLLLQNKWTLLRQLYSGLMQSNPSSVQSF